MQAVFLVLPELDAVGTQPVSTPEGRPGDRAAREPSLHLLVACEQLLAGGEKRALARRPGRELAAPWPSGEVGVGVRGGDAFDLPFRAHLRSERWPVEAE